jgi:GT2 family glycosyltransferase
MFIKSSAFQEMGGLEEDFFAHMEEIDLCWRLKSSGYKIYFTGSSTVYHVGGGTLAQGNPKKTYLNFRNGLLMLYRNLPSGFLLSVIAIRLFLDYLTILKFGISGKWKDCGAILKAHRDFLKMKKNFSGKRKNIRKEENYRNLSGLYNRPVFFDYFILRRTKFTDLELKSFSNPR